MADSKGYQFFQNRQCEYFPCHEVEKEEDFNCLFCYCPLYQKERCLGHPSLLLNEKARRSKIAVNVNWYTDGRCMMR